MSPDRQVSLPERAPLLFWLLVGACGREAPPDDSVPPPSCEVAPPGDSGLASALGQPVHFEGRGLVLEVDGAEVHVPYVSGALVPVAGGGVVDPGAPDSFSVHLFALEVVVAEQTIQGAMTGGEGWPFREVMVRTEGDSLTLRGAGRGAFGLPFHFRAVPRVTSEGDLLLDLEKVDVLGIGVKTFLGTFQGAIEASANRRGHLLEIDEDHLLFNPFPFAGPPEVEATFTSFEVRDHDLVARLGELPTVAAESGAPGLLLSGGALRSGDAILYGATLRLVARDGGDLVLDIARFDAQVEGGSIKLAHDGSMTLSLAPP